MQTTTEADTMIYRDLTAEELINQVLSRKEAVMAANGALCVATGKRTGRSPNDRFIVRDSKTENTVAWGVVNKDFTHEKFVALWDKVANYLQQCDHFVSHYQVGADPKHAIPVTVITEHAWQNLFANNLFIRDVTVAPHASNRWTVLSVPSFFADPEKDGSNSEAAIIFNFTEQRILICGTAYAGEIKKSLFTVMNFLLPEKDILPMHCAANMGKEGDVALFFGLSGTGKTTLSADPERSLIGDDEHGWSAEGVFNFEGGCYAKCIDLSPEREPLIWNAIKHGAIMENVVLDKHLVPNYSDSSLTQNSRAAYPLEHIEPRVQANRGGHPNAVIFLTCDLYGVLPPVARLSKEQAAYYFLSGYTALVGSTEMGSGSEVKPTFSTCFGAPFFPRQPTEYANLLMKRIEQTHCAVYLVNTGWTGGAFGEGGNRFSIPTTRNIIHSILSAQIQRVSFVRLPLFNLDIPTSLNGVESQLLDPRKTWKEVDAYQQQAKILIQKFNDNFNKFNVDEKIKLAGPLLV